MITYHTKRVIISIVKMEKIKSDRAIYQKLREWLTELVTAKKNNDKHYVEILMRDIQERRARLRRLRCQVVKVKVELKSPLFSKQPFICDLELDHSKPGIDKWKNLIKEAENNAIRNMRYDLKLKPISSTLKLGNKGHLNVLKIGNTKSSVYSEAGTILKAHVKKNMHVLYDGKTPQLRKRYVGVELEFCASINEDNFALKLFQKGMHKYAQLKKDGSLRPNDDEQGYELALLLEETNYKKQLKEVCSLLKSVKAVAKDRRAGLHVHIDMRHRKKDIIYNNFVACQYALLSIVSPERYDNEFCKTVNSRKFPTEFTGERHERYKTINAAAYYKYRTLEIRMHEGSIDYIEISNWVALLLKIANYPKKMKYDIEKLATLNARLKLNKQLFNYTLDRSCTFQVQNNEHTQRMRQDTNNGLSPVLENRLRELNYRLSATRPELTLGVDAFVTSRQPLVANEIGTLTTSNGPATNSIIRTDNIDEDAEIEDNNF